MNLTLQPLHSLVLAAVLATLGIAATAQPVFPSPSPSPATAAEGAAASRGEHRMGRHDPAKMQKRMARMQERMAKRQAELKGKLQITPAQEAAWTSYTASMQPPAQGMQNIRHQRPDFSKLTAPERVDQMQALRATRTQRMAEMNARMDRRGDATKTLYAALTPDQKKVFDAETSRQGGRHHGRKHGWHHRQG